MTANEVHLIYFSPTHTSKQVGEAIVRGTGITNVINTNLTQQATQDLVIAESALAIIVVPVYGGRVAPLAMDRLASVRGSNTPAVIVVVYGNRAYEKSLMELDYWAIQQGFKVIAGATFIGAHSYSTEKYPVAAGRPDERDLAVAADFGKQISNVRRSFSVHCTPLHGKNANATFPPSVAWNSFSYGVLSHPLAFSYNAKVCTPPWRSKIELGFVNTTVRFPTDTFSVIGEMHFRIS